MCEMDNGFLLLVQPDRAAEFILSPPAFRNSNGTRQKTVLDLS